MIEIIRVDDARVTSDDAFAFIARLNARPEDQIGYVGEDARSIRSEFAERSAYVADEFFLAMDAERIVGAIALDADTEIGRSWIYGPWVDGAENDAIADTLWAALLPVVPDGAREAELFCHLDNQVVRTFASRHGFGIYKEAVILAARLDAVRLSDTSNVRPLAEPDHAAFIRLHDLTFPRTFITGPQIIDRIAESPNHAVFTVNEDGLIGYIFAQIFPETGDANIDLVAVDERARRRGVGRQLVSAAVRWMLSRPELTEVILNTEPDNLPALKLYEGIGFRRQQAMISFRKII